MSKYVCVFILLSLCRHTTKCVLILIYMCPHTAIHVADAFERTRGPHTATYLSACYYTCVLILHKTQQSQTSLSARREWGATLSAGPSQHTSPACLTGLCRKGGGLSRSGSAGGEVDEGVGVAYGGSRRWLLPHLVCFKAYDTAQSALSLPHSLSLPCFSLSPPHLVSEFEGVWHRRQCCRLSSDFSLSLSLSLSLSVSLSHSLSLSLPLSFSLSLSLSLSSLSHLSLSHTRLSLSSMKAYGTCCGTCLSSVAARACLVLRHVLV